MLQLYILTDIKKMLRMYFVIRSYFLLFPNNWDWFFFLCSLLFFFLIETHIDIRRDKTSYNFNFWPLHKCRFSRLIILNSLLFFANGDFETDAKTIHFNSRIQLSSWKEQDTGWSVFCPATGLRLHPAMYMSG